MKDYAKRTTYPPQRNKAPSNGNGALVILIACVIVFLGYAVYHFLAPKLQADAAKEKTIVTPILSKKAVIKPHKPLHIKPILLKTVTHSPVVKPKKQTVVIKKTVKKIEPNKPTNPADIQPKYDFYKLLPQATVLVPTQDQTRNTGDATVQPSVANVTK